MNPEKFKVYTAVSSFSHSGMTIKYDPKIPNLKDHDLLNLANYYSVVLNYGECGGALYGPLPIAYHTEYLLYVYTFEIKDPKAIDPRVKKNGNLVPAFLLIFFPTSEEKYTAKARDNISQEISTWIKQFTTIQDFTENHITKINSNIESLIYKEQSQFALSEIEEANVVIGKSIELLHNIVKYNDKPTKLLISGTDDILLTIATKAIFENNSGLVTSYKLEDNRIEFKLKNIEGNIILTTANSPNTHKYLSNNLDGVLHFANFSTTESTEAHTNEFHKIIKQTPQNCIVSFAISQTDLPIKIRETKIPQVLKEGVGRTISLIDLAETKNTISSTILEFLDRIVESVGQKV